MNQPLQSNTTPTVSSNAISQWQVIIDRQVLKTERIVLRLIAHGRLGTVHAERSLCCVKIKQRQERNKKFVLVRVS
jgi:hypothetical protein